MTYTTRFLVCSTPNLLTVFDCTLELVYQIYTYGQRCRIQIPRRLLHDPSCSRQNCPQQLNIRYSVVYDYGG